jgi:hypothetical protein
MSKHASSSLKKNIKKKESGKFFILKERNIVFNDAQRLNCGYDEKNIH